MDTFAGRVRILKTGPFGEIDQSCLELIKYPGCFIHARVTLLVSEGGRLTSSITLVKFVH